MPTGTDQGWQRLTPTYQRDHARGRRNYDRFWGGIDQVQASHVTASAPSTVVATITYDLRDGRVVVERTSFGLVHQDGMLKIARSSVLSDSTR
jgi:hypothetical protein